MVTKTVYSQNFLIMSNNLTKRFSIIVTKSWNSRTNCCLVYLSVHVWRLKESWRYIIQDVLDGLGWYIFSILPLGSWARMKSRRVSITDHSFHTFIEWRRFLFLSDAACFTFQHFYSKKAPFGMTAYYPEWIMVIQPILCCMAACS